MTNRSQSTPTRLELSLVRSVLRDCLALVAELERRQPDAAAPATQVEEAALNRLTLNLADCCALAAALARNEYWAYRGGLSYEV